MAKKNGISKFTKTTTLGPISDLERHLPNEWWQSIFNSLYLKTDGDVVENDINTIHDVDFIIDAVGLEPNDSVLDLCCGQGRHCLELARRGFRNVTGMDRSRYLIRLARKRAKAANLNVNFHEGDARKIRLGDGTRHLVTIMGNSFGYFDLEEDDVKVLESIKAVLVSKGKLLLDLVDGDWMRENYEKRSWEWVDQNQLVCRERSMAQDGQRLVSREVVVNSENGIIADQFYAERLYSREKIYELLNNVGFCEIRFHQPMQTHSVRGQDLGMMTQRMLISATGPVKTTAISIPKKVLYPEVAVLMGDPGLPDEIKLNGKFNKEDFDTIQRLKDALAELNDYKFSYYNNHASYFRDLKNLQGKFVFNLCDEGFNNNAFFELHVPSLLEMYGIPYSGSGPACLGLCYNKSIIRAIAASVDVPVPLETYFNPLDSSATLPSEFPALVKPNCGDSSIGITKDAVISNPEELISFLEHIRESLPGRSLLIQEYLTGREFSVGIIGNPGLNYKVLPPLEVDYSQLSPDLPKILGYESKWMPDSPWWNQIRYKEADIDEQTRSQLYDYSNILFERCECRDYARFDFRCDSKGQVKLLEVNPNPGWCWDGKFNMMAGFAGLRYSDMLKMIIEAAQQRCANKS